MDMDLTLAGPLVVRQGSGSETRVDPWLGIGGRFNLGHGFALQAARDIGGFGVGSDLAWQVFGALQYRFADAVSLEAGYRYISVDYSDSGIPFDVAMHGPIIGGRIRF